MSGRSATTLFISILPMFNNKPQTTSSSLAFETRHKQVHMDSSDDTNNRTASVKRNLHEKCHLKQTSDATIPN